MREVFEFRVVEEFAYLLFNINEGKKLGDTVRKIELTTSDNRFYQVGVLQSELIRTKGKSFFHGWDIHRHYLRKEIESAELLYFGIASRFEPAGEECGTKYDETTACLQCGAGAKQVSELVLNCKRIPQHKDFSMTIAGEIVVSRRVFDFFKRHKITGVEFHPVRFNQTPSAKSEDWFQFLLGAKTVDIIPPTRVGINPFDEDAKGEYRCLHGDLLGLNLLSEVWLSRESYGGADVVITKQFIGTRRGLLRPEQLIFISPKLWKILDQEKLTGYKVEVAHLV